MGEGGVSKSSGMGFQGTLTPLKLPCVCVWEDNPHSLPFNNHCYRDKREKGQEKTLERRTPKPMDLSERKGGDGR